MEPVMGVQILSAGRGEGKTAFLARLADHVAAAGRSIGGITTPAVFEGERRIGYDLVDLRVGQRWPLARLSELLDSIIKVGAYRFHHAAIQAGNVAVIGAVRDGLDFIAVDEVGPLEFRGSGWTPALTCALAECRPEQTLVVVVRPSLVDELAARFPSTRWAAARRITPPWPDPTEVVLDL
jgi:nucleoside-triphosphatase THEP1